MEISRIKAGTKLELDIMGNDGRRTGPVLVSQFEACTEDRKAIIAAPIYEGNVFNLPNGTEILAYFKADGNGGVSLHAFTAVVTGREVSGNLHLLKIEQTGKITKIQRREYFRFHCGLNLQYIMVSPHNKDEDYKKAITYDLSGGGAGILLNENLVTGDIIECELFIDNEKKVKFCSRIVRCEKNNEEGQYKFMAGLEYTKITNNDREIIVQFIYKEQRKLLKKGLIF